MDRSIFQISNQEINAVVWAALGVSFEVYVLTRWEKNRVKNAEKPAVFSAKKRENRVFF
jgi:hypothetical protein